ncbi:MAG: DNA-binding transcriptional LysR family regulator [Pseudorhodobacter sp.]|jgi:DNA-binding transcriptional LysR family regulator
MACENAWMNFNWDDLRTVLALVRGKTLAAAALELGVNYTTVSRRIARIETAVGQPLFLRLADGYQPTEVAHSVAKHAVDMENAEHALSREMQGRDKTLNGTLTVTAPQLLIAHFLAPAIDQFCRENPHVTLRVRATNELLDLNRRQADLAIRISQSPGDLLKGIRLTAQSAASFATPEWAQRITDTPQAQIDWIVYEQYSSVPQAALAGYPNSKVRLVFDDMVAMLGAAQAGLGVVRLPMFLGRSAAGLVQVPVLPPQPYADIWVVGHADVWPSAKLVAFRDIILPFFKRNRDVFRG